MIQNGLKMVQRNGNQNAQSAEDSTSQGLARRRRAKILEFQWNKAVLAKKSSI